MSSIFSRSDFIHIFSQVKKGIIDETTLDKFGTEWRSDFSKEWDALEKAMNGDGAGGSSFNAARALEAESHFISKFQGQTDKIVEYQTISLVLALAHKVERLSNEKLNARRYLATLQDANVDQ